MKLYNVMIEIDVPFRDLPVAYTDQMLTAMWGYHPAIGNATDGIAEVTLSIQAKDFGGALSEGLDQVRRSAPEYPVVSVSVMTTKEFDSRVLEIDTDETIIVDFSEDQYRDISRVADVIGVEPAEFVYNATMSRVREELAGID